MFWLWSTNQSSQPAGPIEGSAYETCRGDSSPFSLGGRPLAHQVSERASRDLCHVGPFASLPDGRP